MHERMIRQLVEGIGGDTSKITERHPRVKGYRYSEMFGEQRVYMDSSATNPHPWVSIHDRTLGHVATFQFKSQGLMLETLRLILGKEKGDA